MSSDFFDRSAEYDAMLAQGLKFSGESKCYFSEGRVMDLKKTLPPDFKASRILDFGCGVGDTTDDFKRYFPGSKILGIDNAEKAIEYARSKYGSERVLFATVNETTSDQKQFDLCYTNGVFHHMSLEERKPAAAWIYDRLLPGGYFAFFENNPWNPGTQIVMKSIPFDKDAQMLSIGEAKQLLTAAGFKIISVRTLFYFPKFLSFLRFLEPVLSTLPLGAQYWILTQK